MLDSTCAPPSSSKPRCARSKRKECCVDHAARCLHGLHSGIIECLRGLLVPVHLQCAPPSLLCYQTLRDMVNYERSSAGETCAGFREDAEAEANAALGQAKSQAFCHSACGVNVSRYLKKMEDNGCVQWDAYRNAKVSQSRVSIVVLQQLCRFGAFLICKDNVSPPCGGLTSLLSPLSTFASSSPTTQPAAWPAQTATVPTNLTSTSSAPTLTPYSPTPEMSAGARPSLPRSVRRASRYLLDHADIGAKTTPLPAFHAPCNRLRLRLHLGLGYGPFCRLRGTRSIGSVTDD